MVQFGGIGPCFGHSGGTGDFWPIPFCAKFVVCSELDDSEVDNGFSD